LLFVIGPGIGGAVVVITFPIGAGSCVIESLLALISQKRGQESPGKAGRPCLTN
jgi:hypothetical protein